MSINLRILDANINRAREALRVIEDYARFVLDDAHLSQQAKTLRHDLCQTAAQFPDRQLLTARDTPRDVGTTLTTHTEYQRADHAHVVTAAAKRLSEALRCLEEYSKIESQNLAPQFEALRYRCYELEKQILLRAAPDQRLKNVRLYVLLTENLCSLPILDVAQAALDGGADCLQLREKDKTDAQLLDLAEKIARLCHARNALFVMNDRVDLAVLAHADAVHLGQSDLTVAHARKIAGPNLIIGKSTHNRNEADLALNENADYLAVGAIFASPTKPDVPTAGLDLIRHIRQTTSRPIIAIGGIDETNAHLPIQAGASAVAVCQAVIAQPNPKNAAQNLKNIITRSETANPTPKNI